MKKKIIFLWLNPFTKFHSFKYEINYLKKNNISVEINDLSNIILGKNFSSEWKTKKESLTIKFYSLLSWIRYFNKKKNFVVFTSIQTFNFSSFVVELILKFSKVPVFFYIDHNPFLQKKKNFYNVLKKIYYHKFNLSPYIFALKNIFFKRLNNFFFYNKIYLLSNNYQKTNLIIKSRETICVDFNHYDLSNFNLYKKIKKNKKKYAIYLDCGGPYFDGDRKLNNEINKKDIIDESSYYKCLILFFKKLENFFKLKIYIIPHPKYKSDPSDKKSLIPYFNKFKVFNRLDALPALSSNCSFFINNMSTAQNYAVIANKPTLLFYCSRFYTSSYKNYALKILKKKLGLKIIDIYNFKFNEVKEALKINPSKYKNYKYNYLSPKNKNLENMVNAEILKKIILKI